MPNPNITPRPENLTRAGMGQPRKGHVKVLYSLPPELLAKIDEVATQQGWKRNYTITQLLSARLGLQSDYDNSGLDLILKGHIVE